MTYQRLPYDDPSTTAEMTSDCLVAGRNLALPLQRVETVLDPDPMTHPTPIFEVPEAAAELASGLHLHFD